MAGEIVNDVYSDITYTRYPSQIDSRVTPIDVNVNIGAGYKILAVDQIYNDQLHEYENYTDYVMAQHVNVLQDTVIAIQRTLGKMPQGTFSTVKDRIVSLESKDYDARYIYQTKPIGWAYTPNRDTLYTHKHTGGLTSPSKIDLYLETVSTVPKRRLQLNISGTAEDSSHIWEPLTAQDIYMSPVDNRKIPEAINAQFPRTAGKDYPITGNLHLNKNFYGGLYAEWDAKDWVSGLGWINPDSGAFSGNCAYSNASSGSWIVLGPEADTGYTKLRYGKFVLCVRVKFKDSDIPLPSTEKILQITAGPARPTFAGYGNVVTWRDFYKSDFETPGEYEMIYLTFDHRAYSGANKLHFGIYKHANTATVSIDSITITPSHTSVYDD